ncbi:hypothetical protein [Mesorhizobium sp.]|uniref:hypothetical protein n=1 Tax=Mesorhizobium sp. TaxID=1871066 RepID=UPI000FEA2CDD|nr:hypothetical protein [Mesorhizobium sp.]RWF66825.1 MAG: hypothetical protein EOS47_04355 [Mesorhizobium sp.]
MSAYIAGMERIRGAAYLADYPVDKIIVECEICGWRVQYDKHAMLDTGGDRALTYLIDEIAQRQGCKFPEINPHRVQEHCRARYANIVSAYQRAKDG